MKFTEDSYSRIEGERVVGYAIDFMKIHKGGDGDLGIVVRRGDGKVEDADWLAWLGFFQRQGLRRQLALLRSRAKEGYVVPCHSPAQFEAWAERHVPEREFKPDEKRSRRQREAA